MTRDDLIAILATVDGNQASAPNLLDYLYGKQADAILAAGWRDAQARFARERDEPEAMSIEEWERKHYPRPQQPPQPPISEASDDQILAFYRTVVTRSECDHGRSTRQGVAMRRLRTRRGPQPMTLTVYTSGSVWGCRT